MNPERMSRASNPPSRRCKFSKPNSLPIWVSNGTPNSIRLHRMPRLPKRTRRTRRGTARKNQVYSQATTRRIGLSDSRITAMTTPSVTPMSIARMVIRIVPRTMPWMTGSLNMLSNMNDHSNLSFVTSRCTNMAVRTASTATATHRQGCRTGTALMGSGRARSDVVSVVMNWRWEWVPRRRAWD